MALVPAISLRIWGSEAVSQVLPFCTTSVPELHDVADRVRDLSGYLTLSEEITRRSVTMSRVQ